MASVTDNLKKVTTVINKSLEPKKEQSQDKQAQTDKKKDDKPQESK